MTSTSAPAFDWYGGTVTAPEDQVLGMLAAALADEQPRPARPSNGYGHAFDLRRHGRRVASVSGGGQHRHPHVVGTGQDAAALARLIRHFPHRVSRADVCVDTEDPGAYETLRVALLGIARQHGTTTREISSPTDLDAGRTLYVGSVSSQVMARLYEKGKQLPEEHRPGWVRFELQVKPEKERKVWASTASELDLLGASTWSRAFVSQALGLDPDQAPIRTRRVSDLDGALEALAAQYGGRLLELLDVHAGDVDAWARDLLARIAHDLPGGGPSR